MRKRMTACTLALLCGLAPAQEGDRPGEPQATLPSHWQIPPAPILSPEEERKTFQLADDFLTIELFASEPMVQDPVAMDFDADGRLWVVEMRGYMPDIEGRGEKEPVGRVSILTDTNNDGRADKATVFFDQLVLPRAIKVCWGGALVAHGEQLWFAKDTNGDDVADVRELVDADYIQSGNPEHQPNGLLLALDNWIYSAKSDQRYRRVDGKWIKEKTEFRGQWGITQDDFGRLYYNVNNSQLHADLFPPNYSLRNTNFIPTHAINQRIATNQAIFTLRPNTGVNRAYRPGILDERGHLKEFTSACAPHVYQDTVLFHQGGLGSQFSVFVCEPAANLVKHNLVMMKELGGQGNQAYPDREFLASTDERFRPVWLATSPDGSLVIADMYRGINQHRQYMTSHLRREVLSRGLDKGVHLGRIWRIRAKDAPLRKARALTLAAADIWIKELSSDNGTQRNHAQRLIVESARLDLVPKLLASTAASQRIFDRMHALWAVEGLLARARGGKLAHQSLVEDDWRSLLGLVSDDMASGAVAFRVAAMVARGNPKRTRELIDLVRFYLDGLAGWPWLTAALVLGDLQHPDALELLVDNLQSRPDAQLLREATFSSLGGRELPALRLFLKRWPEFAPDRDVVLKELAAGIATSGDVGEFSQLLTVAGEQHGDQSWRQLPLLSGVLQHRLALRRNPLQLATEPAALPALRASVDPLVKAAADSIATFLDWPGHTVERPPVVQLRPLTGAFAQQFAEGRVVYQKACAACHGLGGEGLPSLAPPLLDSEWLTGPADRVIRIVLHGLEGPIEVSGRTYAPPAILPSMPAVDSLNDMEIAAMMSYVTRELGQTSRTNTADEVAIIRNRFGNRTAPWSAAELAGEPAP